MSVMGWVEAIGAGTLLFLVKLGIPVVVISCIGYYLYLKHRKKNHALTWTGQKQDLQVQQREAIGKHCWEIRECNPEVRDQCPAYWQPGIPCWIALKQMFSGRIQNKCLNCPLLLSR